MFDLIALGKSSKKASLQLIKLSEEQRNNALKVCAKALRDNKQFLIEQNAIDVENAKKKGMSDAFIDRLLLSDKVIEGMAVGLEQVSVLDNPLGKTEYSHENLEQGIFIEKIRRHSPVSLV